MRDLCAYISSLVVCWGLRAGVLCVDGSFSRNRRKSSGFPSLPASHRNGNSQWCWDDSSDAPGWGPTLTALHLWFYSGSYIKHGSQLPFPAWAQHSHQSAWQNLSFVHYSSQQHVKQLLPLDWRWLLVLSILRVDEATWLTALSVYGEPTCHLSTPISYICLLSINLFAYFDVESPDAAQPVLKHTANTASPSQLLRMGSCATICHHACLWLTVKLQQAP